MKSSPKRQARPVRCGVGEEAARSRWRLVASRVLYTNHMGFNTLKNIIPDHKEPCNYGMPSHRSDEQ